MCDYSISVTTGELAGSKEIVRPSFENQQKSVTNNEHAPLSFDETIAQLDEIGIDILEPETRREETMAEALEEFSTFVLVEERELCAKIIEKDMGRTVGALAGGSDDHEIYRALITDDSAAAEWIREFHSSRQGKRYANVFTVEKLQQYMLGMCDKRSEKRGERRYSKLGNCMFIMAFGHASGQVRHIDGMNPNVQICLYMSKDCPSTVAYALEEPCITSSEELLEHWEASIGSVPAIIRTVLTEKANQSLKSIRCTKWFAFWDTIDVHLKTFGKLYQTVSRPLALQANPGTILIAGGNEVHAGPRTTGPRMFAFAIGIPEDKGDETENDEDKDGEVQYTPVQLHIDLCCILFSLMDSEYVDRHDEHFEAKMFLLSLLIPFIREYPTETYDRLMGDDRMEVRSWLGNLVQAVEQNRNIEKLLEEAIASSTMFYNPCDKKKRRAQHRRLRKRSGKERSR